MKVYNYLNCFNFLPFGVFDYFFALPCIKHFIGVHINLTD